MENNYEKYMYYSMYCSSVPYTYYMMSQIKMGNLYNNDYHIQDVNNENFRIVENNNIQLNSQNNISDTNKNLKQDELEKESSYVQYENTASRSILNDEEVSQSLKLGPATITQNGIKLFGIDFETGDIVLIVVILFLFFEQERDYLLLIVLVLMLFDVSLDSIGEMTKIKDVLKFI